MTKVDIISGFLGAGKTTLIKKLLEEGFAGEKLALIENEFGEVSVDGGFLQQEGVQISELSSGCICCTLVGDFTKALCQVYERFQPDRILIEPSGVGKLSDVIAAVKDAIATVPELTLNSFSTVVDATKVKVYMKNFPEFYNNQVESAGSIILSRTQKLTQDKLEKVTAMLREKNGAAAITTTPWDQLDGKVILAAMEGASMSERLMELAEEEYAHRHGHHHHGHHGHDGHHKHGHGCGCHEHEHNHGSNCGCHEHGHDHHEHGHDCGCGCHGHSHDHHDADEVFASWGKESPKPYGREVLEEILSQLDTGEYGKVLRAKGIVPGAAGGWLEFDYVPGEYEVRESQADYTGRLCVIGAELEAEKLGRLFGL